MTVLHLSDVHFGSPHRPTVAEAVLRLADELRPAAVVASGDLTQRAKTNEFRAAAGFLSRLPAAAPLVVVPGNHDVPLYRFWERLAAPYGKYRRFVSRELDSVLDVPAAGEGGPSEADRLPEAGGSRGDGNPSSAGGSSGEGAPADDGSPPSPPSARFVALNSAAPRTAIVNGRLSDRQLRFAADAFASAPPAACRILVLHHNLAALENGKPGLPAVHEPRPPAVPEPSVPASHEPGPPVGHQLSPPAVRDPSPPPLHGAGRVLERFSEWGVDLVLSGHLHRSWTTFRQGTSLIHAGTASSSRGRGPERGRNSVNVVDIRSSETYVVAYLYSEHAGRFLPGERSRHPRRSRAARVSAGPRQEGEPSVGAGPHP